MLEQMYEITNKLNKTGIIYNIRTNVVDEQL